jgi:hypothetical protein
MRFIIGRILLIVGFLLYCLFITWRLYAQTNMGPIRTPRLNNILYVGDASYRTIQSAVNFACTNGGIGHYSITILPGAAPSDSPPTVTGGCTGSYIADLRVLPHRYYTWSGTAYVLTSTMPNISFTAGGVIDLAVGSMLGHSPLCTEATGCPTQPTSYPPAGIGVSTGSSWDPNSINPADVARLSPTGGQTFAGWLQMIGMVATSGYEIPLAPNRTLYTNYRIMAISNDANAAPLDLVGINNNSSIYHPYLQCTGNPQSCVFNNPVASVTSAQLIGTDLNTFAQCGTFQISNPINGPPLPFATDIILRVDCGSGPQSANTVAQTAWPTAPTHPPLVYSRIVRYGAPDVWHTVTAPMELTTGLDLNTLLDCGNYSLSNPYNGPPALQGQRVIVRVDCTGDPAVVIQTAWQFAYTNVFYQRSVTWGVGNTWYVYSASGTTMSIPQASSTRNRPTAQSTITTPPNSNQSCTENSIWHDDRYLYICTRNGDIKRAALSSF